MNTGEATFRRFKKQTLNATSTAKAEYDSLAAAPQEADRLRHILSFEISGPISSNFIVCFEFQAGMKLTQNVASVN